MGWTECCRFKSNRYDRIGLFFVALKESLTSRGEYMGFIRAVQDLSEGVHFQKKSHPFIQKIWDDETKILQIFLEVKELQLPMNPQFISFINLSNGDIEMDVEKSKQRYQFKRKPGSAKWQYSPLIQLGGGLSATKLHQVLLNQFILKVRERLFDDLEKQGVLSAGSGEKIESWLKSKFSTIESMVDVKYKTTVVFGFSHNGVRYLPGDLLCFDDYFNQKIHKDIKKSVHAVPCSLCGQQTYEKFNLNGVFNFSTFDKPSFLPGVDEKNLAKVFPVCESCFRELSYGRTKVEEKFNNTYTIPKTEIWIIPEVVSGYSNNSEGLSKQLAVKNFEDYIKNDASMREKRVLSALAQQGESLNFHFLFIEKDQSREALLSIIEDISPSLLKKLETIWIKNIKQFQSQGNSKLDSCFLFITYTIMKDGKSKTNQMEVAYRKQTAVSIVSKLLRGQPIQTRSLKQEFVSRYPQIMHMDEYATIIRNQFRVIEFIEQYNKEVSE